MIEWIVCPEIWGYNGQSGGLTMSRHGHRHEDDNESTSLSGEKISVVMGMVVQIAAVVWMMAVLYSSVNYNKDELEEINAKLSNEFSDLKVRMRAAEREISIMDSIIDMELRNIRKDT